jgi:hypothetical protein
MIARLFHDLDVEVLDPQLGGNVEAVDKGLVFCYIVEAAKWSRIT